MRAGAVTACFGQNTQVGVLLPLPPVFGIFANMVYIADDEQGDIFDPSTSAIYDELRNLSTDCMDYSEILDSLEDKFKNKPVFWSVEPDLGFWLAHQIYNSLEQSDTEARVIFPDKESNHRVQYKSFLDEEIQSESRGKDVKRVVTEVTFVDRNGDSSDRRKFDIGVAKEDQLDIVMNNGTKNYRQGDFDALFELKYVKNDHYYRLFAGETGDEERSMTDFRKDMRDKEEEEIRKCVKEIINTKGWKDDYNLLKDVGKLEEFDVDNKFIVLLSNYDFLYEFNKTSEEMSETKKEDERVYRIIGNTLKSHIEEKAQQDAGIELYYFTPYHPKKNIQPH